MKTKLSLKLLSTFCGLFFSFSISAQTLPKVAVATGMGIYDVIKGNHKKPSKKDSSASVKVIHKGAAFIDTNKSYDLSGKWEGFQINGQLIMYYKICLFKVGKNVYSGTDYCQWIRNTNNAPLNYKGSELPNSKKIFVGEFRGDLMNLNEISEVGSSNWGLLNEKFKLITNNDTLAFINSDGNYATRKFYLKHSGDYPEDELKYLFNASSLKIDTVSFHNPALATSIRYSQKGYLNLSIDNKSAINFQGLRTVLEIDNDRSGIDYNGADGLAFDIPANSKTSLDIPLTSNLMLAANSLNFHLTIYSNGVPLANKHFSIPTDAFFKTSEVTPSLYSTARMRAVAGYYGLNGTLYKNVPLPLDPLVAAGDKMAGMWKAVFLSMGYGEYKIDEALGYTIGKNCLSAVEDKARNGDAEATYLMFYACQMGLEGESGKAFAKDFLQKAANAGFKPAVYDYGMQLILDKDDVAAYSSFNKSYEMGVPKAAKVIGQMYEKGLSVTPDVETAIGWYKKGMAFGDPEATLCYAELVGKGIDNTPPNIGMALTPVASPLAKPL